MFLGLPASAWVILLQALMTATSIASAWFFAMPVIRSQGLDFGINTLRSIEAADADVKALMDSAADKLDEKRQSATPVLMRSNKRGLIWLVISFVLFLLAFGLQIRTDGAFASASEPVAANPHK